MPVDELSQVLQILTAMVTPAVLIMASGSLILTTSNRLTRVIDRVRELARELEALEPDARGAVFLLEKRQHLGDLLDRAIERARLLQRAMTRLYLALGMFVGTSMMIGLLAISNWGVAWIALGFVFLGAGLMLMASILLIVESRIGLRSTLREMDFVSRSGLRESRPHSPLPSGERGQG